MRFTRFEGEIDLLNKTHVVVYDGKLFQITEVSADEARAIVDILLRGQDRVAMPANDGLPARSTPAGEAHSGNGESTVKDVIAQARRQSARMSRADKAKAAPPPEEPKEPPKPEEPKPEPPAGDTVDRAIDAASEAAMSHRTETPTLELVKPTLGETVTSFVSEIAAEEKKAEQAQADSVGVPEVETLAGMNKLHDVLNYLVDKAACNDVETLVKKALAVKDLVPVLKRLPDVEERARRWAMSQDLSASG